ncbi:AI-2E family transporter YdiK [Candidatus Binatia bacterium]|nr:AI-2E family transporter YdiK [Candidatus Binatia bacterium]
MQPVRAPDLTRTTFQLLALGGLIAASVWILRPFLMSIAWAIMIVVATWPLMVRVQAWLGGGRAVAVGVLTLALVFVLVVPFYLGVTAVATNAHEIVEWSKSLATLTVPEPPSWVATLPVVGPKLVVRWQQLAAVESDELAMRLAPYAQTLVRWLLGLVGGAGLLLVELLLTVIVTAILWANGETAADWARRFAQRLAGPQGARAVILAALAIRGVALGVVVTAIAQSGLAGLGIAVAGVPFAAVLTAVMFLLSIAQVGPALVLIPAVIWVFWTHGAVWGTAILIWSVACSAFDNFLRPVLIRRGADLPLLLVFAGVIGGLFGFGVIGLFIGPVVLAVAYTLLVHWVDEDAGANEAGSPAGR